jgi:branched-chain amino acid transport system substrate-binding protein
MGKKKTIQNKRNFFFGIFTVLGWLIALSLILMPGNVLARNIKVGIIDCYSGPAALFGNDALNGFKLALKEINQKGVLGKKIEFFTRDTKFKVDLALNMAKQLVLREDVDILVGTINSGAALAVWCRLLSGFQKVKTLPAKKAIVTFSQPEKIRPWPASPAG